jgi:hypothetical protein
MNPNGPNVSSSSKEKQQNKLAESERMSFQTSEMISNPRLWMPSRLGQGTSQIGGIYAKEHLNT